MLVTSQDRSLDFVDVHASFDVSEEAQASLIGVLAEYQKGWPKRGLDILGAEVSGDEPLSSHLQINHYKYPDPAGHIHLELELRKRESLKDVTSRRRKRLEDRALSITMALKGIERLSIQCDIHCTIAWRFLTESVSPIVQLPLLKMDIPGTSFGQVSGIRFTFPSEDPHEYVALDLIGEKELRLLSHFVFSESLSADVLDRVLEKGGYVKDAFVKQRHPLGGET